MKLEIEIPDYFVKSAYEGQNISDDSVKETFELMFYQSFADDETWKHNESYLKWMKEINFENRVIRLFRDALSLLIDESSEETKIQ